MAIETLSTQQVLDHLGKNKKDHHNSYLAMYSSVYGGIVTDPALMLLPIDDHMVHRGDGIFEAFKSINGKIFLLNEHLDRLERSAKTIEMDLPFSKKQIEDVIAATMKAANENEILFRLYVSRGPGGFSTNPYECVGSQLYVVATKLKRPPEKNYENGVKLKKSAIPIKDAWLATVKSCNYLPNVMMKKEAIDQGIDYTVNFNSKDQIGEGSTENIVIVNAKRELLFPEFHNTLRGTTLLRLAELAESLVASGVISRVSESTIHVEDLLFADEIMMVGTTIDVMPVTEFEGEAVAGGKVGVVARACRKLIVEDQQ